MSQLHLQLQHLLLLTGLPRWTWELIHHLALPYLTGSLLLLLTLPCSLCKVLEDCTWINALSVWTNIYSSLILHHEAAWLFLILTTSSVVPYFLLGTYIWRLSFCSGTWFLKEFGSICWCSSSSTNLSLLMAAMLALCHNCKGRNNALIFGSHPSSFPVCSFSVSIAT